MMTPSDEVKQTEAEPTYTPIREIDSEPLMEFEVAGYLVRLNWRSGCELLILHDNNGGGPQFPHGWCYGHIIAVKPDQMNDLVVCYIDNAGNLHRKSIDRFSNELEVLGAHRCVVRQKGESALVSFKYTI